MQSGELIVTGQDSAVIRLNNVPSEVKVRFTGDLETVPCNPQHSDTLEFEVTTDTAGHILLTISWNVSAVREIKWHVAY